MSIKVVWKEDCEFDITTENGFKLHIDAENKNAPCPTEVLLSALGSCSATDVVLDLQKQGVDIKHFTNELSYTLTDRSPRLYKSVNLHFTVDAASVTSEQIEKAASNAINKFCHVCLMLKNSIEVTCTYKMV